VNALATGENRFERSFKSGLFLERRVQDPRRHDLSSFPEFSVVLDALEFGDFRVPSLSEGGISCLKFNLNFSSIDPPYLTIDNFVSNQSINIYIYILKNEYLFQIVSTCHIIDYCTVS
jgi:hypothetical protein